MIVELLGDVKIFDEVNRLFCINVVVLVEMMFLDICLVRGGRSVIVEGKRGSGFRLWRFVIWVVILYVFLIVLDDVFGSI